MKLIPQLAESIDKTKLVDYLPNDRYFYEQKVDGDRKLVWLTPSGVIALNRKGETSVKSDLPPYTRDELPTSKGTFALDGEQVGDEFWIFDLPFAQNEAGQDVVTPDMPYSFRREVLEGLAGVLESQRVHILPSAKTMEDKMKLSRTVIEAGGEGVMVKDSQAKYLSGRRHNGLLKAKFVKDVDVFITRFGVGMSTSTGRPKDNCEIAVIDPSLPAKDDYLVHPQELIIGECIIHPKERNQVDVGSVVAVAYLYCKDPAKPRLVQPTRIRPRDDKTLDECLTDQLRFTDQTVHRWKESA